MQHLLSGASCQLPDFSPDPRFLRVTNTSWPLVFLLPFKVFSSLMARQGCLGPTGHTLLGACLRLRAAGVPGLGRASRAVASLGWGLCGSQQPGNHPSLA